MFHGGGKKGIIKLSKSVMQRVCKQLRASTEEIKTEK